MKTLQTLIIPGVCQFWMTLAKLKICDHSFVRGGQFPMLLQSHSRATLASYWVPRNRLTTTPPPIHIFNHQTCHCLSQDPLVYLSPHSPRLPPLSGEIFLINESSPVLWQQEGNHLLNRSVPTTFRTRRCLFSEYSLGVEHVDS